MSSPVDPVFDYQFRLILIGDTTVGKSSLLRYFTDGKFFEVRSIDDLHSEKKNITSHGEKRLYEELLPKVHHMKNCHPIFPYIMNCHPNFYHIFPYKELSHLSYEELSPLIIGMINENTSREL